VGAVETDGSGGVKAAASFAKKSSKLRREFPFKCHARDTHSSQCLLGIHPALGGGMKHVFRLLILLICLAACESAMAASVTLDWNASSSANVLGYNVYFGTSSGNYASKVDVGGSMSVTISNLVPGLTYYFAATAYDASGGESGFSSEISYSVPGGLTMIPSATPGASPVIQFSVVPDSWYEVQASTDLQHWATVAQTGVMTANILMQFSDPYASQYPSRFYRLVQH
jgi:hypothetical protein